MLVIKVKYILSAVAFVVVACVVHYQLQVTTVDFTEAVVIPARRADVFEVLLDPHKLTSLHPYGTKSENILKTPNSEDLSKIREVRFTYNEKVPVVGAIEATITAKVTLKVLAQDSHVESSLHTSDGLLTMKGRFLLADYKNQERTDTVLIDTQTFTGRRVIANFALLKARYAHLILLKKLEEHFGKKKVKLFNS